jgi:hypothetical protein
MAGNFDSHLRIKVDDWSQSLNQGIEVYGVFFDASKAFDKGTTPSPRLLQQMEEINLNPYLIRFLKDWRL